MPRPIYSEEEEKRRQNILKATQPSADHPKASDTHAAQQKAIRERREKEKRTTVSFGSGSLRSGVSTTPTYKTMRVNLNDMTDAKAFDLASRMETDEERDTFFNQYLTHIARADSKNYRADVPTLKDFRAMADASRKGGVYSSTKASIAQTMGAFDGMIDVTGDAVNMNTADLNTVIRAIRATADDDVRKSRAKAFETLTKTQGSRFYGASYDADALDTFLDSAQLTSADYREYIEDFAAVFSPQPGKEAENREAYGKLRTQIEALEDGYLRQTYLTALDKAYRSQTASDTLPDMAVFAREQEAAAQEAAKQAEQGEDWLEKLIKKLIPPIEGVYETEEAPKSAPPASVPVVTQEAGTYSLTNLMPTEDGAQLLPDPAPLEEEDEKKRGMPDVGAIMEEYGGRGADLGIGGSTAHSGTVDLTGDLAQAWGYKRSGRFNELTRGTQMELAKMAGEPGVQAWMGYIDDNSFWRFAYVAPDDTPETDADNTWYEAGNERADSIETGSLHMSLGAKMLGIYAKINADDFPEDLRNMAFMTGVQLLRSANEWQIESGFVAEDGSNVYDAYIAEHPNDPAWFSLNYAIQLSEVRKEEARRAQEESANAQARDAQKQLEIDRAAYESRNYTQQQYDNVRSNAPELTRLVLRSDERYVELFNEIDDEWLNMDTRWMTDTVLSPAVRISGDAEYVEGQRGTYESIAHEYLENALLGVTQIAYSLGYDSLAAYEEKHGEVTLEALHSMATLDMQRFASSITQEDVDAVQEIAQQTQYSGTGEGVSAWDVAGSGMATGASDAVSGMLGGFYTMTANTNLPNDIARARIIYNKEFGFFAETQLKADLLEMAQGGYFPQEGMGEYITEYLNAGGNPFSLGIVPGDFEFARKTAVKYREVGDAYRAWAKESMRANQGKWFDRIAGSTDNSVRMLASSLMTLGTGSKVLGLVAGYGMSSYAEGAEGIYAQDAQYIRETGTLPTTSTMKWANVAGLLQMSATVASEYVTFGKWLGNVAGFGALKSSAKAGLEKLGASGTARLMKGLAAFSKSFGRQMWDEVFVDEMKESLLSYGAEEATDRLRALDENGTLSLIRGIDEMLMSAGAAIYHTDEALGKVVQNAPEMAWVVGLTSILGAGGAMHAAMKETYEAAEKAVQTGDPRDIAAFTQTCHQEIAGASEEQLAAADAALTDTQIAETAVGIAVTDPEIAAQIEDAADAQRQAAAHRESRDASAAQAKAGFESVAAALDDIDAGDTSPEAVGRVADGMDAAAKGRQGEAEHERTRKAKQDAADKGFTQAMHEATDKASAQVQAQKQAAQAQLDEAYVADEADEAYVRGIEEKLGVETKRKNTRPTPAVVNDDAQSEQASADQPGEAERQARRKPPQEAYADDGESETTAVQTPESKPEESAPKRKNTRPTPAIVDDGETDAKLTGMTKGEAVADVVAEKVFEYSDSKSKRFEEAVVDAVYEDAQTRADELGKTGEKTIGKQRKALAKKIIARAIAGDEEIVKKLNADKDIARELRAKLGEASELLSGAEARLVQDAASAIQTGEVKRKNLRSAAVTADDGTQEEAQAQEEAPTDEATGFTESIYEDDEAIEDDEFADDEDDEDLDEDDEAYGEIDDARLEEEAKPSLQLADAEFLAQVTRKFGVKISMAQDLGGARAMYHRESDTVTISQDATRADVLGEVVVHELTHRTEGTKEYGDIADALLEAQYHGDTARMQADIDEIRQRYAQHYAKIGRTDAFTAEDARKELVADIAGRIIGGDEKLIDRLVADEPGIARRIVQAIRDIIAKLRGEYDAEAAQMERVLRKFAKAQRTVESRTESGGFESNVQYKLKDDASIEVAHIKDQIRSQQESLNSMEPVAAVMAPSLKKESTQARKVWALDSIRQYGFRIDVPNIGVVEIGEKEISDSLRYLTTDGELAAFGAIPRVLKRGIQIGGHENHKGRTVQTITIAAPVVVNGARGNMAVVVKKTTKNRYKTHRILMPDGSAFEFDAKKATPKGRAAAPGTGVQASTKSVASNTIIPESGQEGNTQFSLPAAPTSLTEQESASRRTYATGKKGRRQFVEKTLQESRAMPQQIKDALMRDPNALEYDVDSNDAQLMRAWERIQQEGVEAVTRRVLEREGLPDKDGIAEANVLMAMASRDGNFSLLMALARKYVPETTEIAQSLQSMKLFKRMTPTGAMAAAAAEGEKNLAGYIQGHQPKARKAKKEAERVSKVVSKKRGGDPIAMLASGEMTLTAQNSKWGVPINEQQQALIEQYDLENVRRPGIHYNRATLRQRMLEAILATPNVFEMTNEGLTLIDRLEMMKAGAPVVTNADLRYIGHQLSLYTAMDADGQEERIGQLALARAYEANANITQATLFEKINGARFINMLLNTLSPMRNVIGNTLQTGVNTTSHSLAATMDSIVSMFTGTRTVGRITPKEMVEGWEAFVQETVDSYRDYFIDKAIVRQGEGRFDVNRRGRVYQGGAKETARLLESFLMSVGDRNFWKMAYVNSMNEQMRVARRNGAELDYEAARTQAEYDANYATFNEDNAVREAFTKLKNAPVIGPIVDLLMPFTGVPTNIIKRQLEYGPAGLAYAVIRHAARAMQGKTFDQKAFVTELSRGLTGVGLMALGFGLKQLGMIKGGTSEEEDSKAYYTRTARGDQYTPYIRWGDKNISLSTFSPAVSPILMGASAYDAWRNDRNWINAGIAGMSASLDSIIDASYFSTLADILSGDGTFGEELFPAIAESAVTQSVPSLLGQFANMIDPYVRDTKDADAMMAALKKAASKIPGLRETLPIKYDVTGEAVRNTKYGAAAFLDPFTTTFAEDDPVIDELIALGERTGSASSMTGYLISTNSYALSVTKTLARAAGAGDEAFKKELTPEQKNEVNRRYGELLFSGGDGVRGLRDLMASVKWERMSDEEKLDAISDMKSEAKEAVTLWALKEYGK